MVVFDDVSTNSELTFYNQYAELQNGIPVLQKKSKTVIPINHAEPLKLECQHCIHCIESRQAPLTSLQNGIDVLTVLQCAQVSLEVNGKNIRLKEIQIGSN